MAKNGDDKILMPDVFEGEKFEEWTLHFSASGLAFAQPLRERPRWTKMLFTNAFPG